MDTYYDTDSQWKMDKFVSREGNDRSKMLKTAKYSSIKMIMMMDLAQHGLKRVKSALKNG